MASIRKHGNKWQARITRKGVRPLTQSFVNKTDAEAWARRVESELERGLWQDAGDADTLTLSEALDRYNRERAPLLRSAKTEEIRARTLKRYPLAKMALSRIRGAQLAEFRDKLLADGLKPSTVIKCIGLVSRVFSTARKDWGMEGLQNPVSLVRKPKEDNARNRRLQPGELERIIAITQSPELPEFLQLAVETGMRRGELAGLQWKHIDLQTKTAYLPLTKNGESRTVPLSSKAVAVLQQLGGVRRIDGKVFGNLAGNLTQAFVRALTRARARYEQECNAAGKPTKDGYLQNLRIHDLRHEAVSRFFELGLNPMEVAAISGHKTLAMLQRYTHLRAEELARKLG